MRIITASIVALLGMATSAAAYDPYPFQGSDGKWGYVNDDHCWVIAPQFEDAEEFNEAYASIQIGDEWGLIDASGNIVIHP